jgi:galacturan 1,4-alpha-galacturonidase
MHLFTSLATVALAATSVIAAPAKRDSCTFTNAADAIKNKKSCSTITLNNIAVPAGTTLDLTNLAKGTNVVFKGTTTFGYQEWTGPLVSISGDSITVDGTGATLDGDGARWWDGKGTNGGKKKPKFFYAHKMTNSIIKGIVSSVLEFRITMQMLTFNPRRSRTAPFRFSASTTPRASR